MKYDDAYKIAERFYFWLEPFVQFGPGPGSDYRDLICIAGGLRREKPDVHDIEIVAAPSMDAPPLEFGKPMYRTIFEQELARLQAEGWLLDALKNGSKLKQYVIDVKKFGFEAPAEPFKIEFYLVTPPAQFGVDLMIRTGPGEADDNFSQWIVTPRSKGGALPDGYRVKHAAVWRDEQLDSKGEPKPTELPLQMPTERSFFKFLGMDWINPPDRHAKWGRR